MYIAPNTTVRLLTGVPLDNTYAHTIYFANKNAQTSYFQGKTKSGCLFSNVSYQRYSKGVIRLQKSADDIYDCNYMMFQNSAYGTRWFYAFINTIEYVSNTVCEITYEIDVMQTWFFDVTLLQSFVEREHSTTDVAGDNIVPEPVPLGEDYYGVPRPSYFIADDFDVVIVSPYRPIDNPNTSSDPVWIKYNPTNVFGIQGTPTALCHAVFNSNYYFSSSTSPTGEAGYSLMYYLDKFTDVGSMDDIACAYIVPHACINYVDSAYPSGAPYKILNDMAYTPSIVTTEQEVVYFDSKPSSLSHGYTPKNKKLLTYPYNKILLDTNDGNTYDYAFEFFSTDNIRFNLVCNLNINMSFKAIPLYYKGEDSNYSEGCILTDFPTVGLVIDSFKAWYAQNKTRLGLQVASDVLGVGNGLGSVMAGSLIHTPVTKVLSKTGAKMMAGGFEEIGRAGVRGVGQTIAELTDRSKLRYHPKMGSVDGSLEIASGKKDVIAIQCSVNPQNAQIIDDFFNCYGYATHRVKVPNRNARPHWTYVKTIDINLESNAPSDDTNKIASIYDNGITFWVNGSEVGNYSLDNSPSS